MRSTDMAVIALALPLCLLLVGWHLSATTAWIGSFELVISLFLIAAVLATCIATVFRIRRLAIATAALMLTANAVFMVLLVLGIKLGALRTPDTRFGIVLASATLFGVAGLVAKRQWARWLGLALGAAGLGSGGLNAINFWDVSGTLRPEHLAWYLDVCKTTWVYCVTALGGAVIIINLVAARDVFVAPEAWSRREPVVRALRASMIASFVATPMLLVYAWTQPIVAATRNTALVLALTLTIATVLAARSKLSGALLLVVAGLGLAAQTIATLVLATGPQGTHIATYYAVFWSPAAIAAIVSGCLLAKPVARLLASPQP